MISLSESPINPETCPTAAGPVKIQVVSDGCLDPWEVGLGDFPIVVGRSSEAEIQVRDRWVSRRHCEIDLVDGALIVRDLGARHGTYLNGRLVVEEPLQPGDEIRIGLTVLTVVS